MVKHLAIMLLICNLPVHALETERTPLMYSAQPTITFPAEPASPEDIRDSEELLSIFKKNVKKSDIRKFNEEAAKTLAFDTLTRRFFQMNPEIKEALASYKQKSDIWYTMTPQELKELNTLFANEQFGITFLKGRLKELTLQHPKPKKKHWWTKK